MKPIAFALMMALAASAGAIAASDEEICAEARERFIAETGKPPEKEPTPTVLMFKERFCPARLTVKQGAAVRFLNVDKRSNHDIKLEAGAEASPRIFPGESFELPGGLPPGEHPYLCTPHVSNGMKGVLVIRPE
jgi:plastocyanin